MWLRDTKEATDRVVADLQELENFARDRRKSAEPAEVGSLAEYIWAVEKFGPPDGRPCIPEGTHQKQLRHAIRLLVQEKVSYLKRYIEILSDFTGRLKQCMEPWALIQRETGWVRWNNSFSDDPSAQIVALQAFPDTIEDFSEPPLWLVYVIDRIDTEATQREPADVGAIRAISSVELNCRDAGQTAREFKTDFADQEAIRAWSDYAWKVLDYIDKISSRADWLRKVLLRHINNTPKVTRPRRKRDPEETLILRELREIKETTRGFARWMTRQAAADFEQHVEEILDAAGANTWISSTRAAKLAELLGCMMTTSTITKLCANKPAPFKFRKPARNRREVHLPNFINYVLEEIERRTEQEEPSDLPGIDERYATLREEKDRSHNFGNLD